jgi:hypothetical protein
LKGGVDMTQRSRNYKSFIKWLTPKEAPVKPVKKLTLTPEELEKIKKSYTEGRLQHLDYMAKDFEDTRERYRGSYQIWRDVAQPFIGLKNIGLGLVTIIGVPFVWLYGLGMHGYTKLANKRAQKPMEVDHNYQIFKLAMRSALIDGFFQTLRGVTQVCATPLSWFVKIPIRGVLTCKYGFQKIEEDESIKNRLKDLSDSRINEDTTQKLLNELAYKFDKNLRINKRPSSVIRDMGKQIGKEDVYKWNRGDFIALYKRINPSTNASNSDSEENVTRNIASQG